MQYRLFHSYNYSTTDMWQYYLKPFAAAVAANVSAAMCEYSGTQVPGVTGQGPEPWGVSRQRSIHLQCCGVWNSGSSEACAFSRQPRMSLLAALNWPGSVVRLAIPPTHLAGYPRFQGLHHLRHVFDY